MYQPAQSHAQVVMYQPPQSHAPVVMYPQNHEASSML
jgi:hypothetical protein